MLAIAASGSRRAATSPTCRFESNRPRAERRRRHDGDTLVELTFEAEERMPLKEFSEKLAKIDGDTKWFDMSQRLETAMKDAKGIDMNVDFYSASVYRYMAIEPDLYTCVFAVSRIAGWMAHVLEHGVRTRPVAVEEVMDERLAMLCDGGCAGVLPVRGPRSSVPAVERPGPRRAPRRARGERVDHVGGDGSIRRVLAADDREDSRSGFDDAVFP